MSRQLMELTNDNWGDSLPLGGVVPPGELLAPPEPRRINRAAIYWALTLTAFLGGAAYGYSFRNVSSPASPAITVVDDGTALVARWQPGSVGVSARTELRVKMNGESVVVPLDPEALKKGEALLPADPDSPAEVSLSGDGWIARARYLAGDPLEPGLEHADAESLRQQITDQRDLNVQMQRRLADLRRKPQ